MEAGTAAATGTGSKTMADMVGLAAAQYGDSPALRYKTGEEWSDVSFTALGEAVSQIGRGLIDLGVEHAGKVAIVSHTRAEWTYAHFGILAAGAISVSVYQTNSADECHYVLEHSESEVVFLEDAEQLEKIRSVRDRLPNLRQIVLFEPVEGADDAITLDELRERGRGRDAAELEARTAAVTKDDVCIFIYTSGTTGPPKCCILSHGNYRDVVSMSEEQGVLGQGEVVYLFLPLAHAFAKLVQFLAVDLGGVLAFWEKDPQKIIPNLMETKPTYFPSVPRIFEKIYTLATSNAEDPEKLQQAVQVGVKVRQLRAAGQEVPAELQAGFDQAEEKLFVNVRNLFGGNIRQCNTGAAPIAKEILEFFYACGVPVMEGYGMTETATVATVNTPGRVPAGLGGQADPGRRGQDRRGRRGAAARRQHLQGLLQERGGHGRDAGRRLAAHRRPGLDRRGRLPVHHRPQEGHHHHRGRQEHHPGQPGERAQAEPLDLAGGGHRRPPALPGRADHHRSRRARARSPASTGSRRARSPAPSRCAPRSRRRSTR